MGGHVGQMCGQCGKMMPAGGCGGGCSSTQPTIKPTYVLVPPGAKLPIEGCPNGVPVPVREVVANGMNCAPIGCVNPGDAPVLVFPDNPLRTKLEVSNSPHSQGVLLIKSSDTKSGDAGIMLFPGQSRCIPFSGAVYVCALTSQVRYNIVELFYS